MAEQDYSLNPGRYVGVVIEEVRKTEEEFLDEVLGIGEQLRQLSGDAQSLEEVIRRNLSVIAGDA